MLHGKNGPCSQSPLGQNGLGSLMQPIASERDLLASNGLNENSQSVCNLKTSFRGIIAEYFLEKVFSKRMLTDRMLTDLHGLKADPCNIHA